MLKYTCKGQFWCSKIGQLDLISYASYIKSYLKTSSDNINIDKINVLIYPNIIMSMNTVKGMSYCKTNKTCTLKVHSQWVCNMESNICILISNYMFKLNPWPLKGA